MVLALPATIRRGAAAGRPGCPRRRLRRTPGRLPVARGVGRAGQRRPRWRGITPRARARHRPGGRSRARRVMAGLAEGQPGTAGRNDRTRARLRRHGTGRLPLPQRVRADGGDDGARDARAPRPRAHGARDARVGDRAHGRGPLGPTPAQSPGMDRAQPGRPGASGRPERGGHRAVTRTGAGRTAGPRPLGPGGGSADGGRRRRRGAPPRRGAAPGGRGARLPLAASAAAAAAPGPAGPGDVRLRGRYDRSGRPGR